MNYIKNDKTDPSWAAQEGPLLNPASNLNLISDIRSTGFSMDIFGQGVGVGITHTEKLLIKIKNCKRNRRFRSRNRWRP